MTPPPPCIPLALADWHARKRHQQQKEEGSTKPNGEEEPREGLGCGYSNQRHGGWRMEGGEGGERQDTKFFPGEFSADFTDEFGRRKGDFHRKKETNLEGISDNVSFMMSRAMPKMAMGFMMRNAKNGRNFDWIEVSCPQIVDGII
jgi:hypothetical protein